MPTMRRLAVIPVLAIVASAVLVALTTFSSPHSAQGIIPPFPTPPPFGVALVVNTTSDLVDPGGGKCSLRAAIGATNINGHAGNCDASLSEPGGTDGILFDIGTSTPVISIVNGPLPAITGALSINGNSGGADRVEIRGPGGSAVSGNHGLTVTANDVSISHLVIDNFQDDGIRGNGNNLTLLGNFIGTNAAGTAAAPNASFGVQIRGAGAHIGGASSGGPCTGDCNLISGNAKDGILVDGGSSVVIKGNFIGTNSTGSAPLGNNGVGIKVDNSTFSIIGGTNPAARNIISGNASTGVWFDHSYRNTLQGNYIGTNAAGTAALPNKLGVLVRFSDITTIGSASNGPVDPAARNIISGNTTSGVRILGQSRQTWMDSNYVGLNAAGTAALGNGADGIRLSSFLSSENVEGSIITRNVVSGNGLQGIYFHAGLASTPTSNIISSNIIGLNAAGTSAIPNTGPGVDVLVESGAVVSGNYINAGGGTPQIISGNPNGITIRASGAGSEFSNNEISGNYIGTNAAGTAAVPNTGVAFTVASEAGGKVHDNNINASGTNNRPNVISGNRGGGIELTGDQTYHNLIARNLIGTTANGASPLGNNDESGLQLISGAHDNTIQLNVLAANGTGVNLLGDTTVRNVLAQNYIGTNVGFASGLGNMHDGVSIKDALGTTIGGEVAPASLTDAGPAGNVIRNNGGAGVKIDGGGAAANLISANSIDNNGGLGIELDNSANDNQTAPILTTAKLNGASSHITGTLSSFSSTSFTIEFFASPACDPSGAGEGRHYLGAAAAMTDSGGHAAIDATFSPGASAGQRVTATAIDPVGNTSEFSNCVTPTGPTATPSPTPSPTPTPTSHPSPTVPPCGSRYRGDADGNGHVDINDVLATLSAVAGVPPGAACAALAEVDCDSELAADDALRILDFVAGAPLARPTNCPGVGTLT